MNHWTDSSANCAYKALTQKKSGFHEILETRLFAGAGDKSRTYDLRITNKKSALAGFFVTSETRDRCL